MRRSSSATSAARRAGGGPGIHPARVRMLNGAPARRGAYVLYWMEASCRADWNHALELAILAANRLRVPVLACYGLAAGTPAAGARQVLFRLQGLRDAHRALARRGVSLAIRRGDPDRVAVALAADACMVVVDRGYLREQRAWRRRAARDLGCRLVQAESDVVVPVEAALAREAYSAAVLRARILKHLPEFLVPLEEVLPDRALDNPPDSLVLDDLLALARELGADAEVPPVAGVTGGSEAATRRLNAFLDRRLDRYPVDRNDPGLEGQSGLSPYLRFGHISPLRIALDVQARGGPGGFVFLEELIVRRELSMNFASCNDAYDRYECLPSWCRSTLAAHARDPRPALYSADDLERARSGDPYWNAAQRELLANGTMHGYMRMYWGKRILEWIADPARAFRVALALNNRWQLDGRDPNSFAGVAWCFGKHDRPWAERPVFGTVRYMNARGLDRKFDIGAYVRRIGKLAVPGGID